VVIVAIGVLRLFIPMTTVVAGKSKVFILTRLLALVIPVVILMLGAVILMLRAGFLRTACLYGDNRQQILTLLQTGAHFFWQLLVFYAMYRILQILLSLLLMRVSTLYASPSDFPTVVPWVSVFCSISLAVVLMKPLLLVPALIIVHDRRAFEAIKLIGQYRLFLAKELILLFAIQQAFRFVAIFMHSFAEKGGVFYYLMRAGNNIIPSVLVIVVTLSAVRFIAGETKDEIAPEEEGLLW